MENNQKITYGLIGLLTLLVAALGGNVFLTEDQLDNAYICSINENVVIAERLSSTMKTAYWTDENNETQSKVCRNGLWLNLKQYAKDNNLDLNILLQKINEDIIIKVPGNTTIPSGSRGTYSCNSERCVVI